MEKKSGSMRDIIAGIILIVISTFLLFTETGKSLFEPFKDCTDCLHLYYYLISYGIALAGIFLLIRGIGIIKS